MYLPCRDISVKGEQVKDMILSR